MAFANGSRLGPYEIVAPLGSGGMGEVYRARDTKLGRDVALKILPDSFTHDPERVARFRREAQVLADGKSQPWLQTPFFEAEATFSPNGQWVAYVSDQTGRREVWARPFPGPGSPVRVSSDGGHEPRWSPSGNELFYVNGEKLIAIELAARQGTLRLSAPRVLFDGGFVPSDALTQATYEVGSDGRFLMIERTQAAPLVSLVLVKNWVEELKRRGPVK